MWGWAVVVLLAALCGVPSGAWAGDKIMPDARHVFRQGITGPVQDAGGAAINVQAFPYGAKCDGTTDDAAKIQAALTAADATNGTVLIPPTASGCAIRSALTVPGDVTLLGGGVGAGSRLVALSTFSGTAMLVVSGAGGGGVRGVGLDLSAADAAEGIAVSGVLRARIEDVTITYDGGGSGTAITLGANTPETHVTNVTILKPGIGLDVATDDALEHFYTDVVVESPADYGVRIARTTTTDTGAIYMERVKVTNPAARAASKGILVTSTTADTAMPLFLSQVVADGQLGGDSLAIVNVNAIYVDSSWFANAAASGAGYAGVHLTNVDGFFAGTTRVASSSRALSVTTGATGVRLALNQIIAVGQTGIYLDGSPTLSDWNVGFNQFVAGSLSNDQAALAAAGSGSTTVQTGLRVAVSNAGGGTNSKMQLCNVDSGATNTCKTLRIGATGDLEIVDNANAAVIWSLTDAGPLTSRGAVPSAQTIGAGGTISADACGGVKRISSSGSVVTSTSNTFTAPGTSNTGCVMEVVNSGANQIDLDINGNFDAIAADDTGSDGDIDLAAGAVVRVASDGVIWRQLTRVAN